MNQPWPRAEYQDARGLCLGLGGNLFGVVQKPFYISMRGQLRMLIHGLASRDYLRRSNIKQAQYGSIWLISDLALAGLTPRSQKLITLLKQSDIHSL